MTNIRSIRSICIVGGGSSGWMTASLLSKEHPQLSITLVESPTVDTIGVGESTLAQINRFIHALGLKDQDWMPECNATYKVSIQFTEWRQKLSKFNYPFGKKNMNNKMSENDPFILKWFDSKFSDEESFARYYNPLTYLAEENKLTFETSYLPGVDPKWDYAYHFDAELFAKYLRDNIATRNGVRHVVANVTKVHRDDNGDVIALDTDINEQLNADLFVDCTGFKSVLLEQAMESKYISFNDVLLNDSALAYKVPYTKAETQLKNYTECQSMPNGWAWTIPLWDRYGMGYVYSSQFISDEKAHVQMQDYIRTRYYGRNDNQFIEQFTNLTPVKIDIRSGKHEKAWVNNVVGIGLSYGFIEPLESSGLLTTHEFAMALSDTLQRRNGVISRIDVDGFNHLTDYTMEQWKDFIVLHYMLSQRDDTLYWKHVHEHVILMTEEEMRDRLIRSPRMYQEVLHGANVMNHYEEFEGMSYIAAGMGYNPISRRQYNHDLARGHYEERDLHMIARIHELTESSIRGWLEYQKSSYEFLKERVYRI